MKKIVIVLFMLATIVSYAQITDVETASILIGKKMYDVAPILDTAVIYYKIHYPESPKVLQKVISVAINDNSVKIYKLHFDKKTGIINKVTVNYRHDNIYHLRDLQELKEIEFHVGTYSTDVVIK